MVYYLFNCLTYYDHRAKLDIRAYEPNKTHHLNVDLEDGAGHILLLLTLCPYQHPNIHSQHTISPQSTLLQQIKQLPQQQQQQYRSLVHHLDYFSFLDDHDLKKEIENLNSELAEKYVGWLGLCRLCLWCSYLFGFKFSDFATNLTFVSICYIE